MADSISTGWIDPTLCIIMMSTSYLYVKVLRYNLSSLHRSVIRGGALDSGKGSGVSGHTAMYVCEKSKYHLRIANSSSLACIDQNLNLCLSCNLQVYPNQFDGVDLRYTTYV